ncbi:aspartate aminotransferase family protein [Pseudoxanthomonas taiwanensis]|jgi:Adenosylmethionine-8-amino-7-oxononanoate aminotransferase|uniref:Aspartate aminotransferase family protein n=1 Tax=Pseudoxanthomonas taiwanensis TaxID=176598 RepID=A0A921NZE2_9GAMM|nr:aspartate aminotransferase family protein [Pseudoxanthomonas taiwanensis]KAF1688591.1 aspartate aminotransferase family protein [Pseudoxanthomonas taiwanensis]MBO2467141.1 aspartate aminotransferase family protein [Xanthomonadaceae bacterium]
MDIRELQRLDAAHHLHPFNDNAALARRGTRILTRGEGCYVWDAEGNRLLDAFAGLWCVNIGYGRRELAEAAARQMEQLAYYNSFFQCTTEPTIRLAAKLAELAPGDINHAFFVNSGSEANDTIFRLVRHFWAVQGKPEKKAFIARHNGYHGTTVAGASLGGMKAMHGQGGLPIPDIHHIDPPYWFGDGGDMDEDEYGLLAARRLEDRILELGPDRVAAFIGEPIMGAIGVYIPPRTYWPEVERICRKYDVLLVADEVICGFGRTGQWFGSQYFGFQPDVMPVAKGITSGYIPLGAALFSDRVARVLREAGGELAHGATYSGHPVCAAVALENLRIMEEERIVERAREEIAPYLARRWAELGEHRLVGQARIAGLVGALELVPDKPRRSFFPDRGRVGALCRDIALRNGLILRATWDTMLLSPPLVITPGQVDELFEKAWKTLNETAAELGK